VSQCQVVSVAYIRGTLSPQWEIRSWRASMHRSQCQLTQSDLTYDTVVEDKLGCNLSKSQALLRPICRPQRQVDDCQGRRWEQHARDKIHKQTSRTDQTKPVEVQLKSELTRQSNLASSFLTRVWCLCSQQGLDSLPERLTKHGLHTGNSMERGSLKCKPKPLVSAAEVTCIPI
jgi:hypothetical protein